MLDLRCLLGEIGSLLLPKSYSFLLLFCFSRSWDKDEVAKPVDFFSFEIKALPAGDTKSCSMSISYEDKYRAKLMREKSAWGGCSGTLFQPCLIMTKRRDRATFSPDTIGINSPAHFFWKQKEPHNWKKKLKKVTTKPST